MRSWTVAAIAVLAACTDQRRTETPSPPAGPVYEWAAVASTPRPGPENAMLVDLDLQLTVTNGWHVYSLTQTTGGPTPLTVKVSAPYEIAGEIVGPPVERAEDPNFGIITETYSGEKIFRVPLKLAASAPIEVPPIEVKIRSQACSDRLCLPARTTTLSVTPEQSKT